VKRDTPSDMPSETLVERFVEISLSQDEALLWDKIGKYNSLYDQATAVLEELKSRPGDHRCKLLALYGHENAQVRLNAAHATLALDRERAVELLQTIADSRRYPQAADAGSALTNLELGIYKPT
jgi:hypothetical protein